MDMTKEEIVEDEEYSKVYEKNYIKNILEVDKNADILYTQPWIHDNVQDILASCDINRSRELYSKYSKQNTFEFKKLSMWSQVVCSVLLENMYNEPLNQNLKLVGISNNVLNSYVIKLCEYLQNAVNSNFLYGFTHMSLPAALLHYPLQHSELDTVAVCAYTKMFDYDMNDFVDSCVNSFFNVVGKQITQNMIISIYIPFIYHAGNRNKFMMRYNITDITKPDSQI